MAKNIPSGDEHCPCYLCQVPVGDEYDGNFNDGTLIKKGIQMNGNLH